MLFNSIPIIIIILCIIALIAIVVRKFPQLSTIDVSTIPEEKEAEIKNRIITERLARKTVARINTVSGAVLPFFKFFQNRFRKVYQRAVDMERKYRKKYKPLAGQEELKETVAEMLVKAEKFVQDNAYASAEKLYIEIISLDAMNIKAYKGLGELYMFQKEYDQAREVYDFIVKCLQKPDAEVYRMLGLMHKKDGELIEAVEDLQKSIDLNKERAQSYMELALVYKALGKYEDVYANVEEATQLVPNHPRYLDLYLDMAIELGRKSEAIDLFDRLKEVNPQNQKLDEFAQRIKEL